MTANKHSTSDCIIINFIIHVTVAVTSVIIIHDYTMMIIIIDIVPSVAQKCTEQAVYVHILLYVAGSWHSTVRTLYPALITPSDNHLMS
jgi:hypothetical protein